MTSEQRKRILFKLAHACAWDMSVAKAVTPRQMYLAQTPGCRERFQLQAAELMHCLEKAGLVLLEKPKR